MKGNKRITGVEQYYTPSVIARQCVERMKLHIPPDSHTWLEPAGGRGSFIDALHDSGETQVISYDIEPKHPLVSHTINYLDESISHLHPCVTLTNPPFGRCNSLSVPFFNKCATVSTHIGFIVPKSWRKWSVINKLHPNFHIIHDEELRVNYESDIETSKGHLHTVFQIWERRDSIRKKITVEDRHYFTKVTPTDADVALTVFGRRSGTVETQFVRAPNTTKMFLKLSHPSVLNALHNVDYSRFYNNVAFIQSLSTVEIRYLLNDYFDSQNDFKNTQ